MYFLTKHIFVFLVDSAVGSETGAVNNTYMRDTYTTGGKKRVWKDVAL